MALNCAARTNLESPDLLAELKGLTVGQKFVLRCGGEFQNVNEASLKFLNSHTPVPKVGEAAAPAAVNADQVPALSILQVIEKSESQLELLVTSYRTGPHTLEEVTLTDDSQLYSLTGLSWEVQSVVVQEDPQKPPEPFPAFPAWEMSYPFWMYGLVIIAVLVLFLVPWYFIRQIKERKKAYDSIKDHSSVLLPLDAFYKEIRKVEKNFQLELSSEKEVLAIITKEFKLYLTRALQIPAVYWPPHKSIKEIKKKYFRIYRDYSNTLFKFFKELERQQIQKKDIPYFFENAQKIVDSIDSTLTKKNKGAKQ